MSCVYLEGQNTFQFNEHDNNNKKGGIVKKLVLVAILVLSAVFVFAQQVGTPHCLKVKLRPSIDGSAAEGVTVRLYQENNEQVRIDSTDDKSIVFILEKDHEYTIEVSKLGRFSRKVYISTKLPEEIEMGPLFRYVMDIELPPSGKLADDFYMDFPIAIISYNNNKDRFEHNKAYTAHIRKKMEEMKVQELVVNK